MRCLKQWRISSRKLIIFLLILPAFADVGIKLKDRVAENKTLKLSYIAIIQAPSNLKAFIASIDVPQRYSADGIVTKSEIKELLAQNSIDVKHVKFYGDKVRILRNEPLDEGVVRSAIENYINSHYKDLVIDRIYVKVPKLNIRNYSIRITPSSKTFGHIYLNVTILHDSKPLKHLRASVKVIEFVKVPVATRLIERGERIGEDDFRLVKKRKYNSLEQTIDPMQLIGSVAKRKIRPHQVIKPSMIEPDYDVKKNSSVKIIYRKGPIRIELLGLALENGKKGDIIKVKNLSSNKVLRCEVLSSGSVRFVR